MILLNILNRRQEQPLIRSRAVERHSLFGRVESFPTLSYGSKVELKAGLPTPVSISAVG